MSFIVDTDTNAWSCHSDSCTAARHGRIGGNVLDFVAVMERCSVREAAIRLQEWFAIAIQSARDKPPTEPQQASNAVRQLIEPLRFVLRGVDYSCPYLAERGVSPEIARHFGIGCYSGRGCMEGRVVIPLHNEDGVLVAYAGRATGQAEPKYRFPGRFRKSLVLYNLHRAIRHGKRVVVEGFFGCLKVHEAGFPCVVALMGASLSQRQELLLERYFHEVTLMLDGDNAGRTASSKIAARLVSSLAVRVIQLPLGRQPDHLSCDQIRCFCDPEYF